MLPGVFNPASTMFELRHVFIHHLKCNQAVPSRTFLNSKNGLETIFGFPVVHNLIFTHSNEIEKSSAITEKLKSGKTQRLKILYLSSNNPKTSNNCLMLLGKS